MKSLTVLYNRKGDSDPIKSPQAATQLTIDKRNNLYLSLGSEIRIISLRRLSKAKDHVIEVIKMQDLVLNKVKFETDQLTTKFNDPQMSLLQLKQFLIQDEQGESNKLLQPKRLKQRIAYLNQPNLFIKIFQVSKTLGEFANISILFPTSHLVTITHNGKVYKATTKKARCKNILAIVSDNHLLIKYDHEEQKCLNKIEITLEDINLMEILNVSDNVHKIVLANLQQLAIMMIENYKSVSTEYVSTNQPFYFIQPSKFNPEILHLASFQYLWAIDISENKMILQKEQKLSDEKVFLHDSITHHTSISWKQDSITKLLQHTQNGIYVSLSFGLGKTFKELDFNVAINNQYYTLKHCINNIHKSLKNQQRVLNFHDLRVILNKQMQSDLEKIALMLHDNQLTELGKNESEKKINRTIHENALKVIDDLKIPQTELKIVYEKFLIHILLIGGKLKRQFCTKLIAQIIKNKFTKINIDPKLIQKRCIFSFQKLKNDLMECIQCKFIGNKNSSKGVKRCYICWGQFTIIKQL